MPDDKFDLTEFTATCGKAIGGVAVFIAMLLVLVLLLAGGWALGREAVEAVL